ncbi:hypothetical protein PSAC2689_20030 [Paraburkholderia sacchari]
MHVVRASLFNARQGAMVWQMVSGAPALRLAFGKQLKAAGKNLTSAAGAARGKCAGRETTGAANLVGFGGSLRRSA